VALAVFAWRSLPVRKYGALRCPDFPLHHKNDAAIEQPAFIKRTFRIILQR